MTDDLVKRLRDEVNKTYGAHPCGLMNEAANRIEALEAANLKQSLITVDHLSRIEALEAALQKISDVGDNDIPKPTGNLSQEAASLWVCLAMCVNVARAALAGEKKDD